MWGNTRYDRQNNDAFATYAGPDFAAVRLNAFRPDGSRRPADEIIGILKEGLAAGVQTGGGWRDPEPAPPKLPANRQKAVHRVPAGILYLLLGGFALAALAIAFH